MENTGISHSAQVAIEGIIFGKIYEYSVDKLFETDAIAESYQRSIYPP
jgi:hypothetical protein